ncbi:MAG: CoA-binding protein [Gemmatimonadota bacterium]
MTSEERDWREHLVEEVDRVKGLLVSSKRVAVLGIKPEKKRDQPAFYVAEYLAAQGYDVIPVPVYFPEVTEILGRPVYRRVADVPGSIDIVDVFRRPQDIPPHVDDILAARPKAVWFQLGIRHAAAAEQLARAGIQVVQDRCMLADHQRMLGRRPG